MRVLRIAADTLTVLNAEEWEETPADDADAIFRASDAGHIGDLYDKDADSFSTPAEAVVVPESITDIQALLILNKRGLYQQVLQAVAASPVSVQLFFNREKVWRRDDASVNAIAAALKLSPETVDALFTEAATL